MGQLRNFKRDLGRILDADEAVTKSAHYARNQFQRPEIDYVDVIMARGGGGFRYERLPDVKSQLHQFGPGHEANSKWVATRRGDEEYVFHYEGGAFSGQFAFLTEDREIASSDPLIVESDRNVGTYNFASASDAARHLALDIMPWVKWGNSPEDARTWTEKERLDAFKASIGIGAYKSVEQAARKFAKSQVEPGVELIRLAGSLGDNDFAGAERAQNFLGGRGNDGVDYSAAPGAVTVSLERGRKDGQGFDGWAKGDVFRGIENLTGSDWGDILIGDGKANQLTGGGGNDILVGQGGRDLIDGGAGIDDMRGGKGSDTFIVRDERSTVIGGKAWDVAIVTARRFDIDADRHKGVEIWRLSDDEAFARQALYLDGTDGRETLIGNDQENELYGRGGADRLIGGRGDDDLSGGLGKDFYVFDPGWGADVIREEGGRDTLVFRKHDLDELRIVREIGSPNGFLQIFDTKSDSKVTVWNHFIRGDDAIERLRAADGEIDLRSGLTMVGTNGRDSYQGTDGDDTFRTGDGVDMIRGGAGDDTLDGGSGDDILEGNDGADTYVFRPGFGRDVITEAGYYVDETDGAGDLIVMEGIAQSALRSEITTQGRQYLWVGAERWQDAVDRIVIRGQDDDPLVESIRFGDGAEMSLLAFDALANLGGAGLADTPLS